MHALGPCILNEKAAAAIKRCMHACPDRITMYVPGVPSHLRPGSHRDQHRIVQAPAGQTEHGQYEHGNEHVLALHVRQAGPRG